jgi:hypothetical protein
MAVMVFNPGEIIGGRGMRIGAIMLLVAMAWTGGLAAAADGSGHIEVSRDRVLRQSATRFMATRSYGPIATTRRRIPKAWSTWMA